VGVYAAILGYSFLFFWSFVIPSGFCHLLCCRDVVPLRTKSRFAEWDKMGSNSIGLSAWETTKTSGSKEFAVSFWGVGWIGEVVAAIPAICFC